jgi:lysozyme
MRFRLFSILAILASIVIVGFALSRPFWKFLKKQRNQKNKDVAIHQGDCMYSGPGVTLPEKFQMLGIDVSHHQGLIDWKKVKSATIKSKPISFVFIRATYGRWKNDKYFTYNWKATAQVGILRGAYHYFLPNQSALAQAEKFLSRVCGPDGNYLGELPPVLDIEEQPSHISRTEFHQNIQIWLDKVESKTGKRPLIYSGANFYRLNLHPIFKSYPLWVAHYKIAQPSIPYNHKWDLWQFSDKARINGICEPVDLNVSTKIPSFFPSR